MKKQPLIALACAGGGAHGAYQVGVLKYIHQHFSRGGRSPFQIFTGASCGALNTSFYAAESHQALEASLRLEDLWLGFHVPAYHGNFFKNAFLAWIRDRRRLRHQRRPTWSFLDPSPMQKIIEKAFCRDHLLKAFQEKTTLGIAVAATELLSGRTCWFQEGSRAAGWNLFHSLGIKDSIQACHLEASCSVPVFLPPVKIGSHFFLDGSVNLTKPLNAAIRMGADKILSIGTDQGNPNHLPQYGPLFAPRLAHVIRLLLNRLSHDAAGDEAVEIQTLNQTEIYRIVPSKQIRVAPQSESFKSTFQRRKTRFMFHSHFMKELIEMGYQDAKAKQDDLEVFFRLPEEKKSWKFGWRK